MARIDQYHFYENEWESYEQLRESFEWEVPDRFNMATYVCDRWARERGHVAFFAADESGERRTLTFRDVQLEANRLANYLAEAGITAGDRIGICLGQRPKPRSPTSRRGNSAPSRSRSARSSATRPSPTGSATVARRPVSSARRDPSTDP